MLRFPKRFLKWLFVIVIFPAVFLALSVVRYSATVGIISKTEHGVIRFEPLPTTSSPGHSEYEHQKFTEVQEKRRRQVDSVCRKYNLNKKKFKDISLSLVADVDDKFVFCSNYKVASSNWRRAIAYVNGNYTAAEINAMIENSERKDDLTAGRIFHRQGGKLTHSTPLKAKSIEKQKEILKKAFKFTCVRNPFERLLSAWRDKFLLDDPMNWAYLQGHGKKIIRMFRDNATKETLETGDGVTFREFLQYLIFLGEKGRYDIHWRPFYLHCQFCVVNYDVITHLETISSEAPFVLKRIAGNRTVSEEAFAEFPAPDYGPSSNQWNDNRNTSTLVESYYKDIPKHIIDHIRKLYAIDFEMFGYDKYLPFEKRKNKSNFREK